MTRLVNMRPLIILALVATLGVDLHDPAQIISMSMSQASARRGDVVHGNVTATKNTASVEVRVGGYSTVMTKTGSTTFVCAYRIPWLPFFLHRTWTVRVIARNVDGVPTERDTSILIH